MCEECGCGLPGEGPIGVSVHHGEQGPRRAHDDEPAGGPGPGHDAAPAPGPGHVHAHAGGQAHSHGGTGHSHEHAAGAEGRRTIEVRRAILERNDRLAERNRGFFRARGLLVLNVLSAPGSGKTTLLRETLRALGPRLKAGIVVGDLATDNDARRLRESGAPVVQITTGTVCHLDAEMVAGAVRQLALDGLDLLVVENVGNLVCPAAYDLGEDLRVVLLSVTEGEDKPLKYPPIFQGADVVVISKIDLAAACGYDRDLMLANLRRVAARARVFETSARTGQGLEAWSDFLLQQRAETKARGPLD